MTVILKLSILIAVIAFHVQAETKDGGKPSGLAGKANQFLGQAGELAKGGKEMISKTADRVRNGSPKNAKQKSVSESRSVSKMRLVNRRESESDRHHKKQSTGESRRTHRGSAGNHDKSESRQTKHVQEQNVVGKHEKSATKSKKESEYEYYEYYSANSKSLSKHSDGKERQRRSGGERISEEHGEKSKRSAEKKHGTFFNHCKDHHESPGILLKKLGNQLVNKVTGGGKASPEHKKDSAATHKGAKVSPKPSAPNGHISDKKSGDVKIEKTGLNPTDLLKKANTGVQDLVNLAKPNLERLSIRTHSRVARQYFLKKLGNQLRDTRHAGVEASPDRTQEWTALPHTRVFQSNNIRPTPILRPTRHTRKERWDNCSQTPDKERQKGSGKRSTNLDQPESGDKQEATQRANEGGEAGRYKKCENKDNSTGKGSQTRNPILTAGLKQAQEVPTTQAEASNIESQDVKVDGKGSRLIRLLREKDEEVQRLDLDLF
ncbi:hypothetical protein LSTR_LSTR014739 [Laodelphax striatellus]|uniref:Uncharacterized protein n=1 Tax=Laodelphax striatellus TaxID=195883 RepID=A0A482WXS8_LAOST|nr:hypothetical protein LSTR_LSTR014739 [Laodelphax striatellus]